MIKKVYLLLFIVTLSFAAQAQTTVDVHFNGLGFLDNREYKEFVDRSHTYSGARVALDFGLNLDSLNSFVIGANGIHEFGGRVVKFDPVAYYQFKSSKWQFNAGMFPREGLLSNFPRALLNDTLRYYRPNLEGLLAQYRTSNFKETFFIDWVRRQTITDREQFIFGASGSWRPRSEGSFYVSHYFMLLHDAGAMVLTPDDHINDNGGAQIRLGLDLSHKQSYFDSLVVEAGGMVSLERSRGVNGFRTGKGVVASAYFGKGRLALYDEFYKGEGSRIDYGDSYYSLRTYNRIDVIYTPFLFKGIKGQFIFSFHQSSLSTGSSQQAFRISYDIGRKTIARFKD